jgi:L-fucose/D-arabinose isomerase
MGMYTAVANADQWKRDFGIDVEYIDQYEIILRSELVDSAKVEHAFDWLEKVLGKNIHYDGKKLTPELLERQTAAITLAGRSTRKRPSTFSASRRSRR